MKCIDNGNYLKHIPETKFDVEELARRFPWIKYPYEAVCDATFHSEQIDRETKQYMLALVLKKGSR